MEKNKIKTIITVLHSDITKIKVDVLVNAANKSLLGGGGVDGAIHRAAGDLLFDECKTLNGCETGDVKYTKAYNITAKWILHAVGPVWHLGLKNEPSLLAQCYSKSLKLAADLKCNTIAFPNISTGVYGFPKRLAARIAIGEVRKFVIRNNNFDEIIFVNFDEENYAIYQEIVAEQD